MSEKVKSGDCIADPIMNRTRVFALIAGFLALTFNIPGIAFDSHDQSMRAVSTWMLNSQNSSSSPYWASYYGLTTAAVQDLRNISATASDGVGLTLDLANRIIQQRSNLGGPFENDAHNVSVAAQQSSVGITEAIALNLADYSKSSESRARLVGKDIVDWQTDRFGSVAQPFGASQTNIEMTTPSEGLSELANRYGMSFSLSQQTWVNNLDSMPEPGRSALVDHLNAFLEVDAAVRTAFAQADQNELEEMWNSHRSAPYLRNNTTAGNVYAYETLADAYGAYNITFGNVLGKRWSYLNATLDLIVAFDSVSPVVRAAFGELNMCPAFAIDFGGSSDSYEDDCAFLLDFGGNDAYTNNAGGSNLNGGSCEMEDLGIAAALVDLGGDDVFGNATGRDCGSNGGGFLGFGSLISRNGDDQFRAGSIGTNGGGALGTGALIKLNGSATYESKHNGANGGGMFGLGLLMDLSRTDNRYIAGSWGVNGGSHAGFGALLDDGGKDLYNLSVAPWGYGIYKGIFGSNGGASCGSILKSPVGLVPGLWGGYGILIDGGTDDDRYISGYGAANGGADCGVGMLLDMGGNDWYSALNGGTNGGGYRWFPAVTAAGTLLDASGNDTFNAPYSWTSDGGGMNGGAEGGFGLLISVGGDDEYISSDRATNGGALLGPMFIPGVGALLDNSGDDIYNATSPNTYFPGVSNGEAAASLGMLLDMNGTDVYASPYRSAVDDSTIPAGILGFRVDVVPQNSTMTVPSYMTAGLAEKMAANGTFGSCSYLGSISGSGSASNASFRISITPNETRCSSFTAMALAGSWDPSEGGCLQEPEYDTTGGSRLCLTGPRQNTTASWLPSGYVKAVDYDMIYCNKRGGQVGCADGPATFAFHEGSISLN